MKKLIMEFKPFIGSRSRDKNDHVTKVSKVVLEMMVA